MPKVRFRKQNRVKAARWFKPGENKDRLSGVFPYLSPFLSLHLKDSLILGKAVQTPTETRGRPGLPPLSRGRPSRPSVPLSLREAGTPTATPPSLSALTSGPWSQLASGNMVCSHFPNGGACSGCIFLWEPLGSQEEQAGALITATPAPPPANSQVPLTTHTWTVPPGDHSG